MAFNKTDLGHTVLKGYSVSDTRPPECVTRINPNDRGKTVVTLPGSIKIGDREQSQTLYINEDILSRHSLFSGGTGSGKTNVLKFFGKSIRNSLTQDDVLIFFDTKGDFYKTFYRPGDVVVSNSKAHRNIRSDWNIYKEILVDGFDSESIYNNASEITKAFFREAKEKTSQQFFPNAAQDLLKSILIAQIRLGEGDAEFMQKFFNNKALKHFLDTMSTESISNLLNTEGFEDLASAMIYLGNGGNEQALGVLSEIQSNLSQLFIGTFASDGRFSMREFVRNRGAKVLFIEYDLSIGETLTPLYKLLFDLALKEAMSLDKANGNVYLMCDEFKLLPHLYHIEDGVNFGRSLGVKIFASIQSVEQMYEIYGEYKGRNILAGFSSIYAFKSNDTATREFVSNLFGKNVVIDHYQSPYTKGSENRRDGKTVEDWDLLELDKGDCIIGLPFEKPFKFTFEEFKP